MKAKINSRKLGTNNKATRCRAHKGQIKQFDQYQLIRVQVGQDDIFNVPVCRVCGNYEDTPLLHNMIAEARRHCAENDDPGRFSTLISQVTD